MWILLFLPSILTVSPDIRNPIQYDLANDILSNYQKSLIPKVIKDRAINVTFSLQLYQIIQVNEPQQYVLLNAWVVEKWVDQMLGWDPMDFENETEILVRHDDVWLPDTMLYNSLEMDDSASRRLMHVKLVTKGKNNGAMVELLYPTIYKISCLLNLRFFPFDMQKCRLTFGSWSYDNSFIDYYSSLYDSDAIGLSNFLENDAWSVLKTHVIREEKKYSCCPNNYTMLQYDLVIQRKPLYYVLNLIAPTAVITFISIVGFFTSSSVHDLRQEKITLGITTLLSMSIMIFMVSDKMPSTSTCIPLIGIFYTLMIAIISFGTLAASTVIFIQKLGSVGKPPSPNTMKWTHRIAPFVLVQMPLVMRHAYAKKAKEEKMRKRNQRKESMWAKVYKMARDPNAKQKFSTNSMINSTSTPKMSLAHPKYSVLQMDSIKNDLSASTKMDDSITMDSYAGPMESSYEGEFLHPRPNPLIHSNSSNSIQSVFKPVEVQVSPFNTRNIVELEWDWVAAVIERCFLIVFIVIFVFSSIGINLVGYFYWYTEKENIQSDWF